METAICRHIKTNGRRCKSPSLGLSAFCYFHSRLLRRHKHLVETAPVLSVNHPNPPASAAETPQYLPEAVPSNSTSRPSKTSSPSRSPSPSWSPPSLATASIQNAPPFCSTASSSPPPTPVRLPSSPPQRQLSVPWPVPNPVWTWRSTGTSCQLRT
jgi:hypothetical protein